MPEAPEWQDFSQYDGQDVNGSFHPQKRSLLADRSLKVRFSPDSLEDLKPDQ